MYKTALNKQENSLKSNENIIESVTDALNVTNQQLADDLGVSRATVENWKYHNINPSVACLRAIIGLLVGRIHALSRLHDMASRAAEWQKEREKPRRRGRKTSGQTPTK